MRRQRFSVCIRDPEHTVRPESRMMRSSLLALDQTADAGVSVPAEICDTVDGSRPWLAVRDEVRTGVLGSAA